MTGGSSRLLHYVRNDKRGIRFAMTSQEGHEVSNGGGLRVVSAVRTLSLGVARGKRGLFLEEGNTVEYVFQNW